MDLHPQQVNAPSCTHHARAISASLELLQRLLGIPDVRTRSGRKRMLHDFDSVFGVLERCLQRDDTDPHIIASIAVLLAHLETDITLRTLIHRRYLQGFLLAHGQRFINRSYCNFCNIAGLVLFAQICHYRGDNYLALHDALSSILPTLVDLLRDLPENSISTSGFHVLSHVLPRVKDDPRSRLSAVQTYIRYVLLLPGHVPLSSFNSLMQDMSPPLVTCASLDDGQHFPVVRFLVGVARTADAMNRRRAMSLLVTIAMKVSPTVDFAQDMMAQYSRVPQWDSSAFLQAQSTDSSREEYTCADLAESIAAFSRAMKDFVASGDSLVLALTLCELIREDPLAVSFDGDCSARFQVDGRSPADCGLPFRRWVDTLSHCAQVVQTHGIAILVLPVSGHAMPAADVSDVLRIQHAILSGDLLLSGRAMAQKARERSPREMFFHYAIMLAAATVSRTPGDSDVHIGVLRDLSHYLAVTDAKPEASRVLVQMTRRNFAYAAFFVALSIPLEVKYAAERWGFVVQPLIRAAAVCKEYLADGGGRDDLSVLAIQVLCGILTDGPTLPTALRAAPRIDLRRWCDARDHDEKNPFRDLRHDDVLQTLVQTFLDHYANAAETWDDRLRRYAPDAGPDEFCSPKDEPPQDHHGDGSPEARNAWMRAWILQDRSTPQDWANFPLALSATMLQLGADALQLRRCEQCSEHGALLKKCGGCRAVSYCSETCQRAHWRIHRSSCGGS